MTRHYRQENPRPEAKSEPMEDRRRLVAEAFHTFGEHSARRLAKSLNVPFETCHETIARAAPAQS